MQFAPFNYQAWPDALKWQQSFRELHRIITDLHPPSTINVLHEGARGDGVANDATAINAAFVKAKKTPGSVVFFPPGRTYLNNGTIGSQSLTDTINDVTVIGYGATLKCGLAEGTINPAMRLIGSRNRVYGLTFDWTTTIDILTHTNSEGGDCLYIGGIAGCSDLVVQDCRFNGAFYSAVRVALASGVRIQGNVIDRCLATSIFGVDCVKNIKILDNEIYNSKDDPIFVGTGPAAAACRRVIIRGNQIENSHTRGIGVGGCNDVEIVNNEIDNTWSSGIQLEAGAAYSAADQTRRILIQDNTIRNAGKNYGVGKVHPSVSGVPNGMYFVSAGYNYETIKIEHNSIKDSEGYGILGSHCRHLFVHDNMIDGTVAGLGISIGSAGAADRLSVVNLSIHDNHVYNTSGTGIQVDRVSFGIVSDNHIRSYGAAGGAVDRAIHFNTCDNLTYQGNFVYNDTGAEGTIVETGCTNMTSANNHIA